MVGRETIIMSDLIRKSQAKSLAFSISINHRVCDNRMVRILKTA